MIPVEYTAGGAALGTHHKAEGTPDKHADKIAYIEEGGYEKDGLFVNYSVEIQYAYNCDKS